MLCEAVNRLLVLVPVVARSVVVRVFFLDHLALFVCKELDGGVHAPKPRVLIDLLIRHPLLGVDLKETSEEVACLR